MKTIINSILKKALNDRVQSITAINHGSVNQVFDTTGKKGQYIVRLNVEEEKEFHIQKEKWCYAQVSQLGIPSPLVLGSGKEQEYHYMILSKIEGINGSNGNEQQKMAIWYQLGQYAATYHQIKEIPIPAIQQREFHKSWKAKLDYNINELSPQDSLLKKGLFSTIAHQQTKQYLSTLQNKKFNFGLVHGDVCPRNVIFTKEVRIYLIDWETAEIGIVPHTEIGVILTDKTANEKEFAAFLEGIGLSKNAYQQIEKELRIVNLLSRLDLYRWAEGQGITHKNNYIGKLQEAYMEVTKL